MQSTTCSWKASDSLAPSTTTLILRSPNLRLRQVVTWSTLAEIQMSCGGNTNCTRKRGRSAYASFQIAEWRRDSPTRLSPPHFKGWRSRAVHKRTAAEYRKCRGLHLVTTFR